jgi:autotransporter-associated beta strand protein
MSLRRLLVALVAIAACFSSRLQAVTIPTVPVGSPGNAGDTVVAEDLTSGYGSVSYSYFISKYDVTNSQYVEFLNAKDPTGANTLGLWNSNMANATFGGISFVANNSNGTKYSLIAGRENHPVNYVTFYDAARFANWLNNGQGNANTETGAYTLLGGTPIPSNGASVTRNAEATIFLPSENEWYKAAFYNPTTSSYYRYPTSNDGAPSTSPPTSVSNSANYNNVVGNLTDVGAYTGTTSPFGAFDMGGDVFQWNEAIIQTGSRGLRGGSWADLLDADMDADFDALSSHERSSNYPTSELSDVGFRVASLVANIGVAISRWTGTAGTSWANSNNWSGSVPGIVGSTTNGDTALFNQSAVNSPLAIDAGRNIKSITFDTGAVPSLTIGTTGGNALVLSAGGTIQTSATVVNPQVVNCPLVLEGDYTFTSSANTSAATLTFGGRIIPGATTGVTTLTLNGTNTGGNTISGVLADNGAGKLAITKSDAGAWTINGVNTYSGATTVTAGTFILGNSRAAQNSTVTINADNGLAFGAGLGSATIGGLAGSGKLTLADNAAKPVAVNLTIGGDGDSTVYSGVLSSAGGITKVGAGTLTLSANNTFTGGTTISAGTIALGTSGTLQSGAVTVNADDGLAFAAGLGSATIGGLSGSGKLALQDKAASPAAVNVTVGGNAASTAYSGVLSGAGGVTKVGPGTLSLLSSSTYTGGTSITAGALQLGDSATINGSVAGNIGDNSTLGFANPNAQTYAGIISGSGGVTKTGAGVLTLSGASTFSGGTAISSGPLQVAGPTTISAGIISSSPVGSGTLTLASGTMLQDDGAARTLANNLIINGNVTFSSAGAGSLTFSPTGLAAATTMVLHNNPTLNVTNTTTIKNVISGTGQSLTKTGAGTLVLGGLDNYSGGTTIDAGTLTVNPGGNIPSGAVTIAAAAGVNPTLNLLTNQIVQSVTTSSASNGSATINIASPGTTLIASGSLTASGTLNVTGGGTVEIRAAPTIAANSNLNFNNATMRFSATSGTAAIGAGVTATVGAGSTLELAGSVSALSSAANRVNIMTAAASNGVLVSGTNQRVGQINGAGSVVINSGSDLTADHIVQSALVIQGIAGSPAAVTIAASDSSGNPLVLNSAGLAPPSSSGFDVASPSVVSGSPDGLEVGFGPVENSASQAVGVPEPSSFVMLALEGIGAAVFKRIIRR